MKDYQTEKRQEMLRNLQAEIKVELLEERIDIITDAEIEKMLLEHAKSE